MLTFVWVHPNLIRHSEATQHPPIKKLGYRAAHVSAGNLAPAEHSAQFFVTAPAGKSTTVLIFAIYKCFLDISCSGTRLAQTVRQEQQKKKFKDSLISRVHCHIAAEAWNCQRRKLFLKFICAIRRY